MDDLLNESSHPLPHSRWSWRTSAHSSLSGLAFHLPRAGSRQRLLRNATRPAAATTTPRDFGCTHARILHSRNERCAGQSVVPGEGARPRTCLLYTSDAADDLLCVDLGGRRIIKKKKKTKQKQKQNQTKN